MAQTLVETTSFSLSNKLLRALWKLSYLIFFRPFTLEVFRKWRNIVLRVFGAVIGKNSNVRATVKIWAPWNLEIGDFSSVGPSIDIYNQGKIKIGNRTIISQKSYLCASTHDHNLPNFPLLTKPIIIGDQVWVAADAFIGPGVTIRDGAVIGARAAVFKNVDPWTIVGGNPAEFIKKRNFVSNGSSNPSSKEFKVKDPLSIGDMQL